MEGKGFTQTSSPGAPRSGLPSSSQISTAMPRPRHCNSPAYTGSVGFPKAKQEIMSVPPEMEERHSPELISRYTYSAFSGSSGEPVEVMVRSRASLYFDFGFTPNFSAAAKYFALVPKMLMPSSSAIFHRPSWEGWKAEPS